MAEKRTPPPDDYVEPTAADAPALPDQTAFFRAPARFGHVPVARDPLGWDPKNPGFRNHYPVINLPTQIVDRVSFGAPELEPNRLIWGDNLHVMRQLPSESVDLIYIDPPFFSNRTYNVIWGDENEERSFSDIWEGGLDGYLIWLNARLYEMKRLLKPTGSIYVHCDWHASHYIKVEMDKIFGYENFRNEIVWKSSYGGKNMAAKRYGRGHDAIFYFGMPDARFSPPRLPLSQASVDEWYRYKDEDGRRYNVGNLAAPGGGGYEYEFLGAVRRWRYPEHRMQELLADGLIVHRTTVPGSKRNVAGLKQYLEDSEGRVATSLWEDINPLNRRARERIGYPTQKPEALIERIIEASSAHGDTVLDVFGGGGGTGIVAQRLGRRWIMCDQSRVAVAVTAERLKSDAMARELGSEALPDFTVEQWGVYEAEKLATMPPADFRQFVLHCYDARVPSEDDGIHGYKGGRARIPVWVGSPRHRDRVTAAQVNEFAAAITRLERYRGDEGLRDGVMLAWGFRREATRAAEELRQRGDVDLGLVRLSQVQLDSAAFREHISSRSTERGDYSTFLTFVQPPLVEIAQKRLKRLHYGFDAGNSQVFNAGAEIINVQWDFDHRDGVFRAAPGDWLRRKKGGKKQTAVLDAQHTFQRAGRFVVACKVQDDQGGEGMATIVVDAK